MEKRNFLKRFLAKISLFAVLTSTLSPLVGVGNTFAAGNIGSTELTQTGGTISSSGQVEVTLSGLYVVNGNYYAISGATLTGTFAGYTGALEESSSGMFVFTLSGTNVDVTWSYSSGDTLSGTLGSTLWTDVFSTGTSLSTGSYSWSGTLYASGATNTGEVSTSGTIYVIDDPSTNTGAFNTGATASGVEISFSIGDLYFGDLTTTGHLQIAQSGTTNSGSWDKTDTSSGFLVFVPTETNTGSATFTWTGWYENEVGSGITATGEFTKNFQTPEFSGATLSGTNITFSGNTGTLSSTTDSGSVNVIFTLSGITDAYQSQNGVIVMSYSGTDNNNSWSNLTGSVFAFNESTLTSTFGTKKFGTGTYDWTGELFFSGATKLVSLNATKTGKFTIESYEDGNPIKFKDSFIVYDETTYNKIDHYDAGSYTGVYTWNSESGSIMTGLPWLVFNYKVQGSQNITLSGITLSGSRVGLFNLGSLSLSKTTGSGYAVMVGLTTPNDHNLGLTDATGTGADAVPAGTYTLTIELDNGKTFSTGLVVAEKISSGVTNGNFSFENENVDGYVELVVSGSLVASGTLVYTGNTFSGTFAAIAANNCSGGAKTISWSLSGTTLNGTFSVPQTNNSCPSPSYGGDGIVSTTTDSTTTPTNNTTNSNNNGGTTTTLTDTTKNQINIVVSKIDTKQLEKLQVAVNTLDTSKLADKKAIVDYLKIAIATELAVRNYETTEYVSAAQYLANLGFINDHKGEEAKYEVEQNVLRQEIAAVARAVAGLPKLTEYKNIFSDVKKSAPNEWAWQSVNALAEAGLIAKNAKFNPEADISKAEGLGMIVKAVFGDEYAYDESLGTSWQVQLVEFAVSKGIISNFTDYDVKATRGFVFELAKASLESKAK